MTRKGIVLAGTVILDIVHMVDRWPEQESVSLVDRSEYGAGGPPHNAAAGLARLQAPFPVSLIGVVGNDSYGDIFCRQAEGYGLETSLIRRRPGAITSHTHVMTTTGTGRRTFFHQPGVNATLTAEELLPPHDDAKIFYLGSPGIARGLDESGAWSGILKAARARGYLTALELVPVDATAIARLAPPLLPHADIVVINDSEANAVTGMAVTHDGAWDWERASQACSRLLDMGVGDVAAIHHPAGAVARRKSGETACAAAVAVPPQEIVGTVGAGDAFFAGMLFGLHENWPLAQCLALGNAAAATSLHSATTSASIRPWAECLAYAQEKGLRPA